MKTIELRQAKAVFSAIVEAAGNGEPTIITRDGKPTAMVVPVDERRRFYPQDSQKNLADILLQYPGGIEFERNDSPSRDVEF
ncbi:type II toxin-antitoxin system Phd/YefM family antitoxin [Mesorhizobium cantuariense]|uniref:Antitoxin n=1 Tax=Mesorhizobium cantuariense TaxID=1300275 RepID=A0ABV7MYU3_9HYPH